MPLVTQANVTLGRMCDNLYIEREVWVSFASFASCVRHGCWHVASFASFASCVRHGCWHLASCLESLQSGSLAKGPPLFPLSGFDQVSVDEAKRSEACEASEDSEAKQSEACPQDLLLLKSNDLPIPARVEIS
jgi:hypothetical protein